jgi:beta-lactamase class A
MKALITFTAIIIAIFPQYAAASDPLQSALERIALSSRGTVGIAVSAMNESKILTVNDTVRFPMQSTYKFHLALAVLHRVDSGKIDLSQKIFMRSEDLLPNTWSPLREKYPGGNVLLPLSEIIHYTVSISDNNGCDILFRLVGGTGEVHRYIQSFGIKNISIAATEEEMHREWGIQYTNWTAPSETVRLLKLFHSGNILTKNNTDFLRTIMIESPTGKNRLKGLLPANAVVAHKTGSSGRNDAGITGAVNDIGIIMLPNGRWVAIAVYIKDSPDPDEVSESVIARIARAVWDEYSVNR